MRERDTERETETETETETERDRDRESSTETEIMQTKHTHIQPTCKADHVMPPFVEVFITMSLWP